eukprot:UN05800
MYYVLLAPGIDRQRIIDSLGKSNIQLTSHYTSLHSSPAGARYGHVAGSMEVTNNAASQLLRLPLWIGMTNVQQDRVVAELQRAIGS